MKKQPITAHRSNNDFKLIQMDFCFLWGPLWWLTAAKNTTVDSEGFICYWKMQVLNYTCPGMSDKTFSGLYWRLISIKIKLDASSLMRIVLLSCKIEKWILLLQYFHFITVVKRLSCLVVIFCYLYYFVEGALCIPWKHTSQGHQGKSM